MASSADAIIGTLLQGTGFGRTPGDFAQQNQQLQLGAQALQQGQLQIDAFKQQQAQAAQEKAAYDQWQAQFLKDPTANNLMTGITRFPKQYQALKAGWDIKDEAAKTSDLSYFTQLHSALDAGRSDLAQQLLQQRIDAEKKAGKDYSVDSSYLDALKSGDASAVNALKGIALGGIAVGTGPDKFASAYDAVSKGSGTHVVNAGGALVDNTGKELYRAPNKPEYRSVGQGDTLVQVGGGDPASSGGAAPGGGAAQYTGGWTPRARNGGDNPDNVVDNKIAGAAQALGVAPTDSIANISPMKIAQAMALSEGGPGSLADRNNNPGNLRNGDGSYKKFPSKEAGLNAAAALVARKLKNGQTTVQSLVEGLPAGGAVAGNGARVVAVGAPKPGYRLMTPQENAASGLDPNVRYQMGPDGQITALGGQSKAQLKPIPSNVGKEIITNRSTLKQIDNAIAELDKHDNAIGPGTGMLGDWLTNNVTDPKGVTARAAIGKIAGQIIHDVSGAAVTLSEEPRFRPYVPLITDTAKVAKTKLLQLRALTQGVLSDYYDQYSESQGYRPFSATTAHAASGASKVAAKPAPSSGWGRAQVVK